jgi:hypothetical protein
VSPLPPTKRGLQVQRDRLIAENQGLHEVAEQRLRRIAELELECGRWERDCRRARKELAALREETVS